MVPLMDAQVRDPNVGAKLAAALRRIDRHEPLREALAFADAAKWQIDASKVLIKRLKKCDGPAHLIVFTLKTPREIKPSS